MTTLPTAQAPQPKLVLYTYWRSSSSYRVRIALAAKKLAFERVAVNLLKDEQSSPEHAARSATGNVPCLVIEGQPFVESVAIVELLDELFPEPRLYPRDPFGRARVRALVEVVNAGTQPFQNMRVLKHVSPDPEKQKEWARHYVARGLAAFERLMERYAHEGVRSAFAYGDALGAADAFLVPQVYSARRFGIDLGPYPRVVAADAAAAATDAVRAAHPDNQPDAQSANAK